MMVIASVEALSDWKLRLVYRDQSWQVVSMLPLIRQGGVFVALRDEALFRNVRIGPRGRAIEWWPTNEEGDVIDIDAESLRRMV